VRWCDKYCCSAACASEQATSITSSSLRSITSMSTDPLGQETGSQTPDSFSSFETWYPESLSHGQCHALAGMPCAWSCRVWVGGDGLLPSPGPSLHWLWGDLRKLCPTDRAKPAGPDLSGALWLCSKSNQTLFWHAARVRWLLVSSSLEKGELRARLANYVVQLLLWTGASN